MDEDLVVSYGVKELLQDIRLDLARIDTKLDHKADKADVEALAQRVTDAESFASKAKGAIAVLAALWGVGGAVVIGALIR